MFPNNEPPKMRDVFRGVGVWVGLGMAVIGWIAVEAGSRNTGFATVIFLGAFQSGMSVMANIRSQAREKEATDEA